MIRLQARQGLAVTVTVSVAVSDASCCPRWLCTCAYPLPVFIALLPRRPLALLSPPLPAHPHIPEVWKIRRRAPFLSPALASRKRSVVAAVTFIVLPLLLCFCCRCGRAVGDAQRAAAPYGHAAPLHHHGAADKPHVRAAARVRGRLRAAHSWRGLGPTHCACIREAVLSCDCAEGVTMCAFSCWLFAIACAMIRKWMGPVADRCVEEGCGGGGGDALMGAAQVCNTANTFHVCALSGGGDVDGAASDCHQLLWTHSLLGRRGVWSLIGHCFAYRIVARRLWPALQSGHYGMSTSASCRCISDIWDRIDIEPLQAADPE